MDDDDRRSSDFFGDAPLLTGLFREAVAMLHSEVDAALSLAAMPWECGLEHRIDVRVVRAVVRGHLSAAVVAAEVLDDVLLVVEELVTNAYRHTPSPRRLRISRSQCAVRVEVSDGESARPGLYPPSGTRVGGRGMALVRGLSRAWGVLPDVQGGKVVWAELAGHP